jgi:hypothetical protein
MSQLYTALDETKDEIRLITLLPKSPNTGIQKNRRETRPSGIVEYRLEQDQNHGKLDPDLERKNLTFKSF